MQAARSRSPRRHPDLPMLLPEVHIPFLRPSGSRRVSAGIRAQPRFLPAASPDALSHPPAVSLPPQDASSLPCAFSLALCAPGLSYGVSPRFSALPLPAPGPQPPGVFVPLLSVFSPLSVSCALLCAVLFPFAVPPSCASLLPCAASLSRASLLPCAVPQPCAVLLSYAAFFLLGAPFLQIPVSWLLPGEGRRAPLPYDRSFRRPLPWGRCTSLS